jgi:hypothetical protein
VGQVSFDASFPTAAPPWHNPYTLALLRSWSAGEPATKLAGLSVHDFVGAVPGNGPILAAIDPIDELQGGSGSRQRYRLDFLAELEDALLSLPGLHLLIIGRERAVDSTAKVLGHGLRHDLKALTRQKALDSVAGPLTAVGRRFAGGGAERLVEDLMTASLIPVPRG